jgi:microsomal prostaglandin-E synthase 2
MSNSEVTQPEVTLYQFSLCPFCNKVKAALDVSGVAYRRVEVSPRSKEELPSLPEDSPKKVPILTVGETIVEDSTTILNYISDTFQSGHGYRIDDEELNQQSKEIENWVDTECIKALPTVIYGTWGEAIQAAAVVARESNFGAFQGLGVRIGGSVVMHMISKRLLKKAGRTDGHAWVKECLDQFEAWLGEKDFVVSDSLSMADVAMHGGLSCVRDFPVFKQVEDRPRLGRWFKRVETIRTENRPN